MRPSIARTIAGRAHLRTPLLSAGSGSPSPLPVISFELQRRGRKVASNTKEAYRLNEAFLREQQEEADEARRYADHGFGLGERGDAQDDHSFSRDMRDEAESSTAPWLNDLLRGQSTGREFEEEVRDDGPRFPFSMGDPNRPTISRSSSNRPDSSYGSESISRSFYPHWRDPTAMQDRPRVLKGVHNRQKRGEGSTPAEALAMNALIDQMLKSMPGISPNKSTGSGRDPGGSYLPDRDSNLFGPRRFFPTPIPAGPARGGRPAPRILEKLESEEDSIVLEMLDGLKEEMGMCRTDVDLIVWAKEKVFKPSIVGSAPAPLGSDHAGATQSPSQTGTADRVQADDPAPIGPTFSPVYPRILAHLLSYIRRYFNNPHLVLALFHHAQTQSPESYLAGCLAPVYNEVLKTRWESFRDLEGVEADLREMQSNGVAWDRGTARTINKIVEELGKEIWVATGWQAKYGLDVHVRLAKLEDRLQKDILEQNKKYQVKMREKAARREKEQRMDELRKADRRERGT